MRTRCVQWLVAAALVLPVWTNAQTGTDPDPVTSAKNRAMAAKQQEEAARNRKKSIEPANLDISIRPGDNFYLHVNGNWLRNNPIPSSKTRWGSFDILQDESIKALRELLEDAAKNPGSHEMARRVGEFYASGMDSASIEEQGAQPIKKFLEGIAKLKNTNEVVDQVSFLRSNAVASPLYSIRVNLDLSNANQYIITIGQGGTTLPDLDNYLKNDPRNTGIRKEFTRYITQLFTLCGFDEATASNHAATVLKMETEFATAQLTRQEMRDPVKLNNKFSVQGLSALTPQNLKWATILSQLGYAGKPDSMVVNAPKFLMHLDSMLSRIPTADWKVFLQWNVIRDAAPYLSSAFTDANFAFSKAMSGQKEPTPRWQKVSSMIDLQLGDLLGKLYVDKYFKPAAKQRILTMIDNLVSAFYFRIQYNEWMSAETRQEALTKLMAMGRKIGYPDKWKTYEGLVIRKDDYLGNIRRCNKWKYDDNIRRLGKPVDRTEWSMTAPSVNGYNSLQKNEIVFAAGILRSPFFDPDADDAINYGGIGAVIGHEITHGFDDQGSQFDAAGNLKDWWKKSDAEEFKRRTDQLVTQFNNLVIQDTIHINGKLTLGENLADLGGLMIAYEAFKRTEQGRNGQAIDGYTPDQRFFINWAQIWRNNILPETAAQRILTDTHAPGMYRCNEPLSNLDAFYKAFDIKPGDKMYKPAEKRIRVW